MFLCPLRNWEHYANFFYFQFDYCFIVNYVTMHYMTHTLKMYHLSFRLTHTCCSLPLVEVVKQESFHWHYLPLKLKSLYAHLLLLTIPKQKLLWIIDCEIMKNIENQEYNHVTSKNNLFNEA